jgi:hypothetical protein
MVWCAMRCAVMGRGDCLLFREAFCIGRSGSRHAIEVRVGRRRQVKDLVKQWRSQDLHMDGVGAREARPARLKAPPAVLGVGLGGGEPPPGRGFEGITPEKILEI